jgi:hypothetical protein
MNTERLKNLFEKSKDKYADAKLIGTTYQTMYNIIYKDSNCKVDLIEKIAKFYKVPVGYFFDEEKSNGNNKNLSSKLDECEMEIRRLNDIIDSRKKSTRLVIEVDVDPDEFVKIKEKAIQVLRSE